MSVTKNKPLRVAFETLGCRSNYADTVELQASVVARGGTPCAFDTGADVYVLNTCTVTDSADRSALRILRRVRKEAPDARIVVTGCMAETAKAGLEEAGLGDIIVGPGQRKAVLDAILERGEVGGGRVEQDLPEQYPDGRKARKLSPAFKSISLEHPLPEALSGPSDSLGEVQNRARYHLRVQEGCENSCTFCIIPTTRGRLSSRAVGDILSDIGKLYELGYQEIVLTGTHLGGFGQDTGETLKSLLEKIRDRCLQEPSPRIRLSSIDPNDLDRELLELVLGEPEIFCNHLHICVQAFSDPVLKRMNRLYSLSEALDIVAQISDISPNCGLGTDIICGFPGESRHDLDESIRLFEELPFSYIHVFPYSERDGTPATRLSGEVDPSERKRRSARWRAISERKTLEFLEGLVGQQVELVAEQHREDGIYGTTREFASAFLGRGSDGDWQDIPKGSVVFANAVGVDRDQGRLLCER